MNQYLIQVGILLDADDHEDAVRQMVAWLDDYRYRAVYSVETVPTGGETTEAMQIDAETMEW